LASTLAHRSASSSGTVASCRCRSCRNMPPPNPAGPAPWTDTPPSPRQPRPPPGPPSIRSSTNNRSSPRGGSTRPRLAQAYLADASRHVRHVAIARRRAPSTSRSPRHAGAQRRPAAHRQIRRGTPRSNVGSRSGIPSARVAMQRTLSRIPICCLQERHAHRELRLTKPKHLRTAQDALARWLSRWHFDGRDVALRRREGSRFITASFVDGYTRVVPPRSSSGR
jgi:hypothetical protein